jgi:hypothetical protein
MRQTDRKAAALSAVIEPEENTQNQRLDRERRDDIVPQLGLPIRGGRNTWVVHCPRAGKVAKITLWHLCDHPNHARAVDGSGPS